MLVGVVSLERVWSKPTMDEVALLRKAREGDEAARETLCATAEKLYAFLPEPLRTAFRLRLSDELTYEEIAAATKAPVNTVATRIFKARALLARLFGAPADGEEIGARGATK